MSGAWKSSDGGSITPFGASTATLTATGTIVSAIANVRGVYLRTFAVESNGSSEVWLKVGGILVQYVYSFGMPAVLPREIFVPAGLAITVEVAGAPSVGVSYDLA